MDAQTWQARKAIFDNQSNTQGSALGSVGTKASIPATPSVTPSLAPTNPSTVNQGVAPAGFAVNTQDILGSLKPPA